MTPTAPTAAPTGRAPGPDLPGRFVPAQVEGPVRERGHSAAGWTAGRLDGLSAA